MSDPCFPCDYEHQAQCRKCAMRLLGITADQLKIARAKRGDPILFYEAMKYLGLTQDQLIIARALDRFSIDFIRGYFEDVRNKALKAQAWQPGNDEHDHSVEVLLGVLPTFEAPECEHEYPPQNWAQKLPVRCTKCKEVKP